jgi:hemerythrin-like domain-containing protein
MQVNIRPGAQANNPLTVRAIPAGIPKGSRMNSPVDLWHAEHRDFARLLELVQKDLAVFRSGGAPNYDLMRDIVQYLRNFPDRYHHPREEIAFRRLALRDPQARERLARLEQEHRVIAAAGDALLKCLDEIAGEAWLPRSAVEASAATYLAYYQMHIGKEEEDILPLADKLLTAEDWGAVSAARPSGPDPLFGASPEPRFRELRRQISAEIQG